MRIAERLTGMSRMKKRTILLLLDLAASLVALGMVAGLEATPRASWVQAGLLVAIVPALSAMLGLQKVKLTAYDQDGIWRSAVLACAAGAVLRLGGLADPGAAITFVLGFLMLAVGLRLALLQLLLTLLRRGRPRRPVVVYGAGTTGVQLMLALKRDASIRPVAFVDDRAALVGQRLAGIRVHAPTALPRLRRRWDLQQIILAMPELPPDRQTGLTQRLSEAGFHVRSVPSFAQLLVMPNPSDALVPMADRFLGRAAIHPDLRIISKMLVGGTVLVTGAGGSIGSELCRHLMDCGPARLLLLDHSEAALFAIDGELRRLGSSCTIVPVLGSIADRRLLGELFSRYRVDMVLHAAAYKHVPLVEANPLAATANNVFGTQVLAECGVEARVRHFVHISTDKAVRPVGVMGASKRMAEMVIQDIARHAPATAFSIVRFGNVLGSSGSVVPLFRAQIERGGPVTLTHHDITRYFMTAEEAARLVLCVLGFPASSRAEVYVLDMGQPVPIRELARRMVGDAGLRVRDAACPDGDIEIRICGLRPGEKLHEELLIGSDAGPTPHPRILRAKEIGLSAAATARALTELRAAQAATDPALIRTTLLRWVECDPKSIAPRRGKGAFPVTMAVEFAGLPAPDIQQSGFGD